MILYFPYLFIYTFQLLRQVEGMSESSSSDMVKGATVPLGTILVIMAMTIPEDSKIEYIGNGNL